MFYITQIYNYKFFHCYYSLLDLPSGYSVANNIYCAHGVHGTTQQWSYHDISEAIFSCDELENCTAIYDYGCGNGNGVYELCFTSSSMRSSSVGSCVYAKGNNALKIYHNHDILIVKYRTTAT